jgi:hypothetical protein
MVEVEARMRDLLELRTYEHIYRDVVYYGEKRKVLLVFPVEAEVLFAVDIRVQAGIDLSQGMTLTRERSDPSTIYVQLPAAEVLSVDADEQSIHEYFQTGRSDLIGLLEIGDQLDAVKGATAADAVERGILIQADENARRLVRNFLTLTGFSEVIFAAPRENTDAQELQG